MRKGADDLIERSEKIDFQDAYDKWWADPEAEVVSCGNPEPVIEWLKGKSTDDWHAIATSWNYDYGSEVLAWILEQEECDRGTAAHVFLTEAQGHWLDDALRNDPEAKKAGHVCNVVLANWSQYRTSELNAPFDISDRMRKEAEDLLTPVINEDGEEETEFEESTFRKIMEYEGQRDAVSNYVCEDGSIKMTVIAWAAKKGIDISGR